jgi:hypothetical protein
MGKPRAKRRSSPTLTIRITEEAYASAKASDSSACLIADEIKRMGYHDPIVDLQAIRFSDREAGVRYIYNTPEEAQHLLYGFDQGLPRPAYDAFVLRKAAHIRPITHNRHNVKRSASRQAEYRAQRIPELVAKADAGTIDSRERAALTRMQATEARIAAGEVPAENQHGRPTTYGPTEVSSTGEVVGGRPAKVGTHDTLLPKRVRVFGRRLLDPGRIIDPIVDQRVREELLRRGIDPDEGITGAKAEELNWT